MPPIAFRRDNPSLADARSSAQRVIAELSHDLRQPLTSMNMNLQCAIRLLQSPTPRLTAAVEALSDCLLSETEIVELLTQAQHRAAEQLHPDGTFALNDLVHEVVLTLHAFEPGSRSLVSEQLEDASPVAFGTSWRLRMAVLTLVRRLLESNEFEVKAGMPIILETRTSLSWAELSLKNIQLSFAAGQLLRPLLDDVAASARRLGGSTSLDVQGRCASLRILLPLATGFTSTAQGGAHGD